jgi:hypothetical protein
MRGLIAGTHRSVPLVLLLIPALLVTLYAVLVWLDPPEVITGQGNVAVLALLALSTWLPVHYSRRRQTGNSAAHDHGTVPVLPSVGMAAAAEQNLSEPNSATPQRTVDAKTLLASVNGDWDLARRLVQSFSDTVESQLEVIASGDSLAIREATQVIEAASATLFATAVALEARRLQDAAQRGEPKEIQRCAERVRTETDKAVKYFRAWIELNAP